MREVRQSTESFHINSETALDIYYFYLDNKKSKIKTENKFRIGRYALDLIIDQCSKGSNDVNIWSYRKNLH